MHKKMFDLENEDQGHGVQHSQWCHSMTNITLCKSHMTDFVISLTVSEILTFQISHLENVGQGHGVQHSP